jgi:hypothetical protein
MTFAVLNKPHEWVAAGVFVLIGLFALLMAWRTWHGKPPLPVRARPSSADFFFGINTFGRFLVSGNLPIAGLFLTLPMFLTILHFNEDTDLIVVHIILWPFEVFSLLACVLSGISVFTLAMFSWPKSLIPPKWRHLPGESTEGTRTRSRPPH